MTKFRFYTIKTILFALSTISIYYFIIFIKVNRIKIFVEIVPFIITSVSSFLISILLYFLFSERPKLPEEIEEEKRKEEEALKAYELREKEFQKKIRESMMKRLPLVEITLSTNEKIKGKFLEKSEYFEEVETENRYYKTSIIKIEKVKD
jgi:hypothetical protein